MIKYPKYLIIGGVKWKLIFSKKVSGGNFYWHSHKIKIDKNMTDERIFQILIHEIQEIILLNNQMRFTKYLTEVSNGDYLFSFDHTQFEIFTNEFSGILKQFMRLK